MHKKLFLAFILNLFFTTFAKNTACFFNWKGNCNFVPSSSINIYNYINSYNTFISNCNTNNYNLKAKDFFDTYIDYDIDIDCVGLDYNFTKQCGLIEIYSVLESCKKINNSDDGKYILYNMPLSCPFLGLGDTKTVWLQGSKLIDPLFANILAHEYGHTLGLVHARAEGSSWEYADCSDPMGCASTVNVCYNAVNANKIGWAKPIIFETSSMKKKIWHNFFLPIFTTSFVNNINIKFENSSYNLFLSIRSSEGKPFTDSGILGLQLVNYQKKNIPIQNAISIHYMNDSHTSYFLNAIQPKNSWTFSRQNLPNITIKYTEYLKGKGGLLMICIQC